MKKLKIKIDKYLDKYLPRGKGALIEAMRYSVFSKGKRIRPAIAVESSRVCGGKIKDVMPAACAIELVHTYSLIHDDLPAMDDDDFRRGKPACHRVFGEANAILAGDALLTLAFGIIAKHAKPDIGMKIIKELSDAIGCGGMVLGQAIDLEFQNKKKDNRLAEKINTLKTARLFASSAKIGALSAGAGLREMNALERFGKNFGRSFQLIDDLLVGDGSKPGEAYMLVKNAKRELDIFGKKADLLKDMADDLLKRKR